MSTPYTIKMIAPGTFAGGTIQGFASLNTYTPDANGVVTIQNFADIPGFERMGFTIVAGTYPSNVMLGYLLGANMNSTVDQVISLSINPLSHFRVSKITVTNASISLTTAAGGVYDAASKGGNALVANSQVYTALSAATKALDLTLALNLREPAGTILYLSLTTAQGAAATADVYVFGDILIQ